MEKSNRYVALSRKDVSKGIEKKGGLSYLSWSYAWNALCEEFPDSTYYFGEPITFPDGTMMVKAGVTVGDLTHEMQLPVMDHRNKAVPNPDARLISDNQMRCFVKAIAMTGIGIGLYLGELSHVVELSQYEKAEQFITAQDSMGFHQFINSLSESDQIDLFNAAGAGRKTSFKADHRSLLKVADSFLDEVAASISDAASRDDQDLLSEVIGELSKYERQAVWGRLSPAEQEFVKQARSVA